MSVDITKLVISVLGITCITICMLAQVISAEAGIPVISAIVGYILGNGKSVSSGNTPATMLDVVPRDKP